MFWGFATSVKVFPIYPDVTRLSISSHSEVYKCCRPRARTNELLHFLNTCGIKPNILDYGIILATI